MNRNCISFLLFTIFAPITVLAGPLCQKIFEHNNHEKYVQELYESKVKEHKGQLLYVREKGSLQVKSLKFLDTEHSSEKGFVYLFEDSSGNRLRFTEGKFETYEPMLSRDQEYELQYKSITHWLTEFYAYRDRVFDLKKTVVENDNLRIAMDLALSKDSLKDQIDNMMLFDEYFLRLNFNIPPKTRIVITKTPLSFQRLGPHFDILPTYNLIDRQRLPEIRIEPLGFESRTMFSGDVLLHERAHTFLMSNFNIDSFVLSNSALHEALADTMTYLYSKVPTIHYTMDIKDVLRDLKKSTSLNSIDNSQRKITGIQDLIDPTLPYHEKSLIYSRLLHDLSRTIGPGQLEFHIFRLLEYMNYNYLDFSHRRINGKNLLSPEINIQEYIFFLSSILSYISRTEHSSIVLELIKKEARYMEIKMNDIISVERMQTIISTHEREFLRDVVNVKSKEELELAKQNKVRRLAPGIILISLSDGAVFYFLTSEILCKSNLVDHSQCKN